MTFCGNNNINKIIVMAEGSSTRDDKFVQRLNFASDTLSIDWKTFKAQFEIFKVAKKYGGMEEAERIANLLVLMGPDSVPIYSQFRFSETVEDRKKTLKNVISMFDAHFEPVKNVIYERVKFNSIKQGEDSIHKFITELQSQADLCEYGEMRDDLIRDRIVVGVNDSKLREYLIDVEELTLQRCIQKAKQYVSHHEHAARMAVGASDSNVDAVRNEKSKHFKKKQGKGVQDSGKGEKCPYCAWEMHPRDKCPARAAVCFKCKGKGHWGKACRGKRVSSAGNDEITEEVGCEELDGLFLGDESL